MRSPEPKAPGRSAEKSHLAQTLTSRCANDAEGPLHLIEGHAGIFSDAEDIIACEQRTAQS